MACINGIYRWVYKERCKNDRIDDPTEQQKRDDLLDDILQAANKYESHIFDHDRALVLEAMHDRGVVFENCTYTALELKRRWMKAFASDLPKETKARIHFKDFLWHAFSYGVLEALEKGKARRSFNRRRKTGVYIFYQHRENTVYINDASQLKSSDFDLEDDVFVFDAAMKWTYVHTHESACGPYFFSKM